MLPVPCSLRPIPHPASLSRIEGSLVNDRGNRHGHPCLAGDPLMARLFIGVALARDVACFSLVDCPGVRLIPQDGAYA